jgi:hypothetical protein
MARSRSSTCSQLKAIPWIALFAALLGQGMILPASRAIGE